MTEQIDLAAIRARLAAATPGPWMPWAEWRLYVTAKTVPGAICEVLGVGDKTEANRQLIAHAPADLAALCDEVERLRAENVLMREIIAGRETPPTDAEIEAHAVADGSWLHADAEDDATTVCQSAWETRLVRCRPGRWWALGPDKRVCAWPVVTEVSP